MGRFTLFIILLSFLSGCKEDNPEKIIAEAQLYSVESLTDSTYQIFDKVVGLASFISKNKIVTLSITLENGIPGQQHAVHIHTGTCEQPGPHWNQGSADSFCNMEFRGELWAKPKAGDVGNILIEPDGHGELVLTTDLWSLGTGLSTDIVGLTIIVHEGAEDFAQDCFAPYNHTHINPKIACGIIELRP